MFKESITTEEFVQLPLRHFEGDIVVVDNLKMARQAAAYLSNFRVIGFDTETKPAFKKGQNHKIALLQLATHERAYLFRTQKVGLPSDIMELFTDPEIKFPGVAIRDDIKALQTLRPFVPTGFIELQDYARKLGIQNLSLKKLCAIACGFRISKSQQLSNWESSDLTPQQLTYAATDAWVSLEIYQQIVENTK